MRSLAADRLISICDRFWLSHSGDDTEFVQAINELAGRGPEIRDWCRRLLTHSDHDARESGAFLLGQLGRRGQLGDVVETVVEELGTLMRRPVEEDAKETQAVDSAIMALAEIGHPAGILHLRAVLFSNDEFLTGDTQWSAAEALGRLVGQPFMESSDPPRAARVWLASHRGAGECTA